jgi:hypothetical protein
VVIKLEGSNKPYHPKDSDKVECETHGLVTTWGALDPIQRLALEEGLDTTDDLPCLLGPRYSDLEIAKKNGVKIHPRVAALKASS